MLKHLHAPDGKEFFTRERCHITELLNDPAQPGLSIARCRVEPGVTTELHRLSGTAETYLIERGAGLMDDGAGNSFVVGVGDSVVIPKGYPQRITNTGEGDLVFLAICNPRFTPDCYQPAEGESATASE